MTGSAHERQLVGSLIAAAVIVAIAIAVVTLNFGPTSATELEAQEERREQRLEAREERREAAEERREDAQER
jgi:hypothetical protein